MEEPQTSGSASRGTSLGKGLNVATSPAHKFGQIIGEVLEKSIEPGLRLLADKHGLFLDVKGKRPAREGRKKITWLDLYGNTHDLDFVLEKNGTPECNGTPVAFVETAWRRYTKHSRNKAQEIQGAIVPLSLTHQSHAPFIGVVLAGEYTEGSLIQLRSLNFHVLHISYRSVLEAFRSVGIDANFGEDTPDDEVRMKVEAWEALSRTEQMKMIGFLSKSNRDKISKFDKALERAITRQVERVAILPLHGRTCECATIAQAINFVENYDETFAVMQLRTPWHGTRFKFASITATVWKASLEKRQRPHNFYRAILLRLDHLLTNLSEPLSKLLIKPQIQLC